MTSTVGPPKTTVNANQFRSTNVYGSFNVMDNSSNSIQARAAFGRDVYIGGNLFLTSGALDSSGAFLDSSSNFEFTLNKSIVSVPVTSLNYIKNVTSDIQTQLNTLSSKSTGGSSSSSSFSDLTFTGSINTIGKGTLDFIKNVTSDIQSQINSSNSNITNINNKITYSITDIAWTPGTVNTTNIANVCTTNILSFSNTLNNISTSTFSFLSGVTSNIQTQINNTNNTLSTVEYRTRDISWAYGAANITTIGNFCNTSYLSFSQSLNNISTTTFGYLNGVTSSIQNQINALANINPPGSVILFAGSAASLSGYLPCDGAIYNSQNYNALFNAIGTIYGDAGNGNFCVPDYRGIFLRGLGTRFVAAQVIGGNQGAPVGRYYTSPALGHAVVDQSIQTTVNNYSLNQQVKRFVTNGKQYVGPPDSNFDFSNAIASESLDITTDFTNYGNTETFPANTSVQYFIKY